MSTNFNLNAEHRCTCGKLLCKGFIRDGEIEIKCKRCNTLVLIKGNAARGAASKKEK